MSGNNRDEQAEQERERQEQMRQQQQERGSFQGQQAGEDESVTNPVIINR